MQRSKKWYPHSENPGYTYYVDIQVKPTDLATESASRALSFIAAVAIFNLYSSLLRQVWFIALADERGVYR